MNILKSLIMDYHYCTQTCDKFSLTFHSYDTKCSHGKDVSSVDLPLNLMHWYRLDIKVWICILLQQMSCSYTMTKFTSSCIIGLDSILAYCTCNPTCGYTVINLQNIPIFLPSYRKCLSPRQNNFQWVAFRAVTESTVQQQWSLLQERPKADPFVSE